MLRFIICLFLICNAFSQDITLKDAPIEWLITSTLQQKLNNDGHYSKEDQLIQEIFQNVTYDSSNDELIFSQNKKLNQLKSKLVSFLEQAPKNIHSDKLYIDWQKENSKNLIPVTLYKTTLKKAGHYYFNHVHTKISQDNSELTWLKLTPKETYKLVENFLKRRRSEGVIALTDHDTDKSYDLVSHLPQEILKPLRGIEWGGTTHMGLIDIDQNWSELGNGRKYSKETSIIKSRSSNGFRIINHPNNNNKLLPYTSWLDANGIEVWNTIYENSPFLIFNAKVSNNRDAFDQWKKALQTGMRYTAVAGSDFHFIIPCITERILVYPVNFIPSNDKELARDNLFKGRSSFITRPTAPKLTLNARFSPDKAWANMGDSIKGNGTLEVQLYGDFSDTNKRIGGICYNTVNNFYKLLTFWKRKYWEIRFYNLNNELIAKRWINPKWYSSKKHFKATLNIPVATKEIIRAELWSVNKRLKNVDLLGATNPIYINW